MASTYIKSKINLHTPTLQTRRKNPSGWANTTKCSWWYDGNCWFTINCKTRMKTKKKSFLGKIGLFHNDVNSEITEDDKSKLKNQWWTLPFNLSHHLIPFTFSFMKAFLLKGIDLFLISNRLLFPFFIFLRSLFISVTRRLYVISIL